MKDLITDTVLFVFGVSIALTLLAVVVWDYRQRLLNRKTISDIALAFWQRHCKDSPIFWTCVGAVLGFPVGLIFGVVMGHLFWPQFLAQ